MQTSAIGDNQVFRFVVNGVVATLVHYTCLMLLLREHFIPSAGIANLVAASIGICCSFYGSRQYVFGRGKDPWAQQFARFAALYGLLAAGHGLILFVWTDLMQLNVTVGFSFALVAQAIATFLGNRSLVFREAPSRTSSS